MPRDSAERTHALADAPQHGTRARSSVGSAPMKHRSIRFLLALPALALLAASCRGPQLRELERRVGSLEARVAVLESQAASAHPTPGK